MIYSSYLHTDVAEEIRFEINFGFMLAVFHMDDDSFYDLIQCLGSKVILADFGLLRKRGCFKSLFCGLILRVQQAIVLGSGVDVGYFKVGFIVEGAIHFYMVFIGH